MKKIKLITGMIIVSFTMTLLATLSLELKADNVSNHSTNHVITLEYVDGSNITPIIDGEVVSTDIEYFPEPNFLLATNDTDFYFVDGGKYKFTYPAGYKLMITDIQGGDYSILDANNKIFDFEIEEPYGKIWGPFAYNFENGNDYKFELVDSNSKPAISGKDTVINNIDNPYTVEQIKTLAGLKAYDEYDGWITERISVKLDNFTPNNRKVGVFTITFEVSNSVNLKTEYVLNVLNQDLTKPIISGPGSSTQSYTVPLDRAALINSYTVTDNYDTNLSVKIDSDNFIENKPGTYTFNLSATDSSGNKSTTTHTLTLIDDVKPTITDSESGVIKYNWKENITDAKLLMGLTANDEIDGVLTSSIKITNNPIKNTLGQYTVTYEVSDKAGNKTSHERTYEIVHVDAPTFWVSDKLISIEDVNLLTLDQLANVLALQNNVTIVDYQVLSDEYSENSNTSGYYAVSMNLLTSEGQTLEVASMVRVFNNSELNEPAPLNIWQKILNVITTIWNFIVNVFKWVWNLIVKIVMFIPNLLKK